MISVTITPLERGEHVDVVVTGGQEAIYDFWSAVDTGASYQRVPLDEKSELELAKLVDVHPIEFLADGRWELRIRARSAEVLKRSALG